jgi:LmbE family N-acetylglucosaminyl deacetylase
MKPRTNPFLNFVSAHARLFQTGKKLPLGRPAKFPTHQKKAGAPNVLVFSPHPDDECIVGGLALRLLREAKWNVINVAVTLGGKAGRRVARLRELKNACDFLGFDLVSANLMNLHPESRRKNPVHWRKAVRSMAKVLVRSRPRVIFIPHGCDGHPAHVGTHLLVMEALKTLPADFQCHVVETEFWAPMAEPNLLVESSVADVADLVAALACHVGEVRRNPYHARLPAGLMDNVRRGAELVGGQGGAAPDLVFATLYRLQTWHAGKLRPAFKAGRFVAATKNPASLFRD